MTRWYNQEYYPRARQVEVIFSVGVIVPTNGFRFRSCDDLHGVRILRCTPNPAENTNGVTAYTITVGSGVFNTGVAPPHTFGSTTSSCYPQLDKSATRNEQNRSVTVGWFITFHCSGGFAPQVSLSMQLEDRNTSLPWQTFGPPQDRLGTGSSVTFAAEPITLFDRIYPRGSLLEVVVIATLSTADGSNWSRCVPPPSGMRYVVPCEIHGSTLNVVIGSGNFPGTKQPPEECRQDHSAINGIPSLSTLPAIAVIPHIEYCGIFDWETNSRITRVHKLKATEIVILNPSAVCESGFFPNPPASDGTTAVVGQDGEFKVSVRLASPQLLFCNGPTTAKVITIDRVYQRNGTVVNRLPLVQ